MNKPKISYIKITNNGNLDVDVMFKGVDAEIRVNGGGITFVDAKMPAQWRTKRYKLVKKSDHIYLEEVSKGGQNIVSTKAYDYHSRYSITGEKNDIIAERYGRMFTIEKDGKNVKLFPVYIDEVKHFRKEIEEMIARYTTKEQLNNKNNEI